MAWLRFLARAPALTLTLAVVAVAAVACGAPPPVVPTPRPIPPPTDPHVAPAEGVIAIGGRDVRYRVRGAWNNLLQVHAVPGSVVALTRTGNLLRFAPESLTLIGTAVVSPAVTCLGGDDDELFAGLSDGTIARVDPATLALTAFARMPLEPRWLGRQGDHLYAITFGEIARFTLDGTPVPMPRGELATGGRPALPVLWRFDRRGRLWWGIDAGEWGGAAGWVDVTTGDSAVVEGLDSPVLGLVELPDGAMWAYGGGIHDGFAHGHITAIDGPTAKTVWKHDGLPVTWIGVAGDRVRVAIWGDVHDVDRPLADWQPIARLAARHLTSHPMAMGATPAVCDATTVGDDVVFATLVDGLFRLRGAAIEAHTIEAPASASSSSTPIADDPPPPPKPVYDATLFADRAGAWWAFRYGTLWRRVRDAWLYVGDFAGSLGMLEPLPAPAPPNLLVDRWYGGLWWLHPRTLERALPEGAADIRDALPDEHGVLLATRQGVRHFDPATGELHAPRIAAPPDRVDIRAVARDGLGRIWFGGAGLYLLDDAGLHDLSAVPGIAGRLVYNTMLPDPDDPGGVLFTLAEGGVIRVATD